MATNEDEEEIRAARLANRFDIRRLIGGLFRFYGLILTAMGIFGSEHVKTKAAGININLWVGISLLVTAACFITWALLRPLGRELAEVDEPAAEEDDYESHRLSREPATSSG